VLVNIRLFCELKKEGRTSRSATLLWVTAWREMRVRIRGRELAGDIEWCEQRGVKEALTRLRGSRRRGKDGNTDGNTKSWEQESREEQRQGLGQQESNLKLQSNEIAAQPNTPKSRFRG
jgi:hypothetical protein